MTDLKARGATLCSVTLSTLFVFYLWKGNDSLYLAGLLDHEMINEKMLLNALHMTDAQSLGINTERHVYRRSRERVSNGFFWLFVEM